MENVDFHMWYGIFYCHSMCTANSADLPRLNVCYLFFFLGMYFDVICGIFFELHSPNEKLISTLTHTNEEEGFSFLLCDFGVQQL